MTHILSITWQVIGILYLPEFQQARLRQLRVLCNEHKAIERLEDAERQWWIYQGKSSKILCVVISIQQEYPHIYCQLL